MSEDHDEAQRARMCMMQGRSQRRPIQQFIIRRLTMQITIRNQRLLRLLGFEPSGPHEPAIAAMSLWMWIECAARQIKWNIARLTSSRHHRS